MTTIKKYKLKCGLSIGIVNIPGIKSITLHLRGLAGSLYEQIEPQNNVGCAHLLEHLILKAENNKGYTNNILNGGGQLVGTTSREEVLIMSKVLRHNLNDALALVKNILFEKPRISDKSLDIEKGIVKNEIYRFESIPEKLIQRLSYGTIFKGSRMEVYNTGAASDIDNITTDNLIDFWERYYNQDSFTLTITSGLKDSKVLKLLKNVFNVNTTRKPVKLITYKNPIRSRNTHPIVYKMEGIKQHHIKIDFVIPNTPKLSTKVLDVKTYLMNKYFIEYYRETLGISYSVTVTRCQIGDYHIMSFYLSFPVSMKLVIKDIKKSISRVIKKVECATQKEVISALKHVHAKQIFNAEKPSAIGNLLSEELTTELGIHEKQNYKGSAQVETFPNLMRPYITIITK